VQELRPPRSANSTPALRIRVLDLVSGGSWRLAPWISAALFLVFLVLWEVSARVGLISPLFFPPPTNIARDFVRLLLHGGLVADTGWTMMRLFVGFLIGGIPALLLGWLMGWLPRLREVVDPFIAALHPIPKVAILPLILVMFGIGDPSRIAITAIAAFFPLLINTVAGVGQINPIYFDTAHNYGVGRFRTFTSVVIPGSLPFVMSGVRVSLNSALVLTITSELLMAQNGLGQVIWFAWQTLRTADLYVGLIVTALIGIGMNVGLELAVRRLIPWQRRKSA
jgi:ABC-type nitrate/sulfonate/bicarbonate transport system permease component